jgi:hypothetical protein
MVVVINVLVKSCLDLVTAGENFAFQELVSDLVKEAFYSAILPGTARLEEASFNSFWQLERSEPGAVV